MLEAARARLLAQLDSDAVVLDVGGWADPFERADWVIDQFPYETRGLYERRGWVAPRPGRGPERFSADTWIERDICDRVRFPFADDEFDFVICSQTLEDVRDPVWVCAEVERVGKAGYIEVPSRLEEQSWGVAGAYVGWPHHHWLVDIDGPRIDFVFKSHAIHSDPAYYFPREFWLRLPAADRAQSLWWEGGFDYRERVIFEEGAERISYLSEFVERELDARGYPRRARRRPVAARARARASRLLGRRR